MAPSLADSSDQDDSNASCPFWGQTLPTTTGAMFSAEFVWNLITARKGADIIRWDASGSITLNTSFG